MKANSILVPQIDLLKFKQLAETKKKPQMASTMRRVPQFWPRSQSGMSQPPPLPPTTLRHAEAVNLNELATSSAAGHKQPPHDIIQMDKKIFGHTDKSISEIHIYSVCNIYIYICIYVCK